METVVSHPLVDARVGDWSVSTTDAARIGLTAARQGLIADSGRAGLKVALVAPEGARLTLPLLAALRDARGEWFTRTAAGALWSPGRGVTLATLDDLPQLAHRRPEAAPLRFDGPTPSGVAPAVQLTVTVRLPAESETRLGRAAEILSAALGAPVDTWGASEPVTRSWDREALTEFARAFAPREVRLVVAGRGDRPLAGIMRVQRTKTGLAEQTTLLAPLAPEDQDAAVTSALRGVLEELQPFGGAAFHYVSTPDAAVPALFVAPPRPIAFVLGARVVRAASVLDRLGTLADVERIGSQKNPGALVSRRRGAEPADLGAAGVLGDDLLRRLAGARTGARRAS